MQYLLAHWLHSINGTAIGGASPFTTVQNMHVQHILPFTYSLNSAPLLKIAKNNLVIPNYLAFSSKYYSCVTKYCIITQYAVQIL